MNHANKSFKSNSAAKATGAGTHSVENPFIIFDNSRLNAQQLQRLSLEMAQLPAIEYGKSVEPERQAILEVLTHPESISFILNNQEDKVVAYIIGLPFHAAVNSDPNFLSYADIVNFDDKKVFYVDDLNIHPDYRHRFLAMKMLIHGFKSKVVQKGGEQLLMHARRENGISAFFQRKGATIIRSKDYWAGYAKGDQKSEEWTDLLRLSLTDLSLPLNTGKWV